MKLDSNFYRGTNVVRIARQLLGKYLLTNFDGVMTGGMIVETEAYSWKERGCHAFGGKITSRNEVMFQEGGCAYVYLCYGIHHLFNVVTNKQNVAEAVLVRAIQPEIGIELMKERRGALLNNNQLTSGPGKLTRALGIDRNMTGKALWDNEVWIEDKGVSIKNQHIGISKRIGIDYAGEDADLPWRFTIKESIWLSK